ncbi:MAG: PilX N-terminal domain-containing pilus assembly protein [Lysobacterales bacterium]
MLKTSHLHAMPVRQQGAALAVGLIFLVVLTLSLLIAFRAAILQERMAGGFRNESLAESAGESALRAGENWIWDWIVDHRGAPLTAEEKYFVHNAEVMDKEARNFRSSPDLRPLADTLAFEDASIASTTHGSLAQMPIYMIEVLGAGARPGAAGSASGTPVSHSGVGGGSIGEILYFRVTARGTGGTDGVVRTFESTFTATR